MRVVRNLERARGLVRRPVVTIGNFDGVHLGHQVILAQLCQDARARGVPSVVLTFDPHPISVVRPSAAPQLLMTLGDRLAALSRYGVDVTVVQRFSQSFAAVTAEDFVGRFLVEVLDAQKIIVGHDLNFGSARSGSVETLVESGGHYGFAVEVIGPVEADGVVVHSSAIRRLVAAGDVAAAARLLGRPHRVRGRVQRGAGRGRGLGFATANVRPKTPAVPMDGVYATFGYPGQEPIPSVTSIGNTPTFDGTEKLVETHLFAEFDDLYGRGFAIDFIARMRDQKRFASAAELAQQIERDVEQARSILGASRAR